jgi:ribosomal-protein-alanine N-acetyltransferase
MIRRATPNDIFKIERIEKEVFPNPLTSSFLLDELSNNPFAIYFVYELNLEVVGYIGFRKVDEAVEMMNFAILKDYQGENIGQTMLYETMNYFKKEGTKSIILEVRKSNKKAQHIYEKMGFIKSHVRKNYYENEDAFVYIKEV